MSDTTAPAADKPVSLPLPGLKVIRPAKRGDGYRVTLGRFVGRGSTLAAAKADIAAQIVLTCETVSTEPAFAWSDDREDLLMTLDRPWGIDTYRVTSDRARQVSCGVREGRTPAGDLANVNGYTPVPLHP
jgi:hypothetical protein